MRGRPLPAIAAATLAAHALLVAAAWQRPEPPRRSPPARVALRLIAAPARPPAPLPVVRPVAARAPQPKRQARPPTPERTPAAVAGIALPSSAAMAPARWVAPPPAPPSAWIDAPQAHAMREAVRAQLAAALQRTLQVPAPADGRCALRDAASLECDNELLLAALAPLADALAGLLRAQRALDPSFTGLAIEAAGARYAAVWTSAQRASGASVTSTPREVTVTAPGL